MRRILDRETSEFLFDLLATPPTDFRRALIASAIRFGGRRGCKGDGRLYLNIGHTGLDDHGFRRWVADEAVRPIYFVHDLIPLTHPEFCRPGEKDKHAERMRTVLDTAAGVIGNSRATLKNLADFATKEHLPSPVSIAALLGCDAILPTRIPAAKSRDITFVILGTIEARKNHLMLLQVWSRLVHRLGPTAPRLMVLGQRGWECEQVLDVLDRSELLKEHVTEVSRCDDEALASHLANARALLFPSFVEGYGLPLAESLRAGTPVIASNLPVFREIAGNVPDYIDPLDGPAWERAILTYMTHESSPRARQVERLARYRPPTWDDHFAMVETWLDTL